MNQCVRLAMDAAAEGKIRILQQLHQAHPNLIWVMVKEAVKHSQFGVLHWAFSVDDEHESVKKEVFLIACAKNQLSVLQQIDIETPPPHALMIACFSGHLEVVKYLQRWRWDISAGIQAANLKGHEEIIKFLSSRLYLSMCQL